MGQRGLIECLQYIECGVYTTHGAYTPVRQRGLLNTTTYFTFLLLSYYYLLYYFTTLLLIPTLLLYYSPSHPRATRSDSESVLNTTTYFTTLLHRPGGQRRIGHVTSLSRLVGCRQPRKIKVPQSATSCGQYAKDKLIVSK
jgi:hypothetical protein